LDAKGNLTPIFQNVILKIAPKTIGQEVEEHNIYTDSWILFY